MSFLFLLKVFNQGCGNSKVKNIINVFKGDANVKVNVIDTSSLYRSNSADGDNVVTFDRRVKTAFHRCMKLFRGGVISASAFEQDVRKFPAAHSIKVSTLLSAYVSEEEGKRSKPGLLKVNGEKNLAASLNFEPMGESSADVACGKCHLSLRGLVPETVFPVDQHFEAHFSVWPPRDQPAWTGIFDRMRLNRQKLLVGFGDEKLGVISATFNDVGVLSLLSKEDSSFYLLITRLKKLTDQSDVTLPESVQLLVKTEIDNNLVSPPPAEPCNSSSNTDKILPFQADCFDSCKVPESTPFCDVINWIKTSKVEQKRVKLKQEMQRAYLPARVSFLMDKKMGRRPSESAADSGFSRPRSEDSVASQISARSKTIGRGGRGAELMRLGSKNAEMRRHSSEDASGLPGKSVPVTGSKPVSELLSEKEVLRSQLEAEVKDLLNSDQETLLLKLMELQHKLLSQVATFYFCQ